MLSVKIASLIGLPASVGKTTADRGYFFVFREDILISIGEIREQPK